MLSCNFQPQPVGAGDADGCIACRVVAGEIEGAEELDAAALQSVAARGHHVIEITPTDTEQRRASRSPGEARAGAGCRRDDDRRLEGSVR
jgi:hypothetical protein